MLCSVLSTCTICHSLQTLLVVAAARKPKAVLSPGWLDFQTKQNWKHSPPGQQKWEHKKSNEKRFLWSTAHLLVSTGAPAPLLRKVSKISASTHLRQEVAIDININRQFERQRNWGEKSSTPIPHTELAAEGLSWNKKGKTNPKIIASWMQRVCDDTEKEKTVNKYHPSMFKNNRDDLFYYARMRKYFFVS